MANRLQKKYNNETVQKLMQELKLKNIMEAPKIIKVTVNSGIGSFRENREAVEIFLNEFSDITGQKPYPRKAVKSEAGFKIRQGDVVGYAVTLRSERMWAFLDKFINIALPRVRDFKGMSVKSFDGNGNYSVGIREHVIFPEINPNTVKGIRGMQVTIVVKSKDAKHTKLMLEYLGFPFAQTQKAKR